VGVGGRGAVKTNSEHWGLPTRVRLGPALASQGCEQHARAWLSKARKHVPEA
jgi:hypothetical protein